MGRREDAILLLGAGGDTESTDFLMRLGIPAVKAPSGGMSNLLYLRHADGLGLLAIVSAGMK